MGLTSKLSGMRVRLRLTLLYGLLFLLSGVVLLTITYFLVAHNGSNVTMSAHSATPFGEESVSIILGETLPADARLTIDGYVTTSTAASFCPPPCASNGS